MSSNEDVPEKSDGPGASKTISFPGCSILFSDNKVGKVVWLFVILCAFCVLTYQLSVVIIEYREYKVNSVLKNNAFGFDFPEVSICKKQPFSPDKITEEKIGIDKAQRFWKFAKNLTDSLPDQQTAYEWAIASFREYVYEKSLFSDALDDVYGCFYLGKLCDRSLFTVKLHPHFLNCVTFSPANRHLLFSDLGLQLLLVSKESFSIQQPYEVFVMNEGYEVFVHEQGTGIPVNKASIFVRPWHQVDISLSMKKYVKQDTPKSKCLNNSEIRRIVEQDILRNLYKGENCTVDENLDEENCIMLQIMFELKKNCSCFTSAINAACNNNRIINYCQRIPRDFYFIKSISPKGTLTSRKGKKVFLPKAKGFKQVQERVKCYESYMKSISTPEKAEELKKKCISRCTKTVYSKHVFATKWPLSREGLYKSLPKFNFSLNPLNMSSEKFINYTFSSVTIYPSDLSVDETIEDLAYPISKLVSDFGGSIGLWIGCSFLTLVEILEFLVHAIIDRFCNKRMKENTTNDIKLKVNI